MILCLHLKNENDKNYEREYEKNIETKNNKETLKKVKGETKWQIFFGWSQLFY